MKATESVGSFAADAAEPIGFPLAALPEPARAVVEAGAGLLQCDPALLGPLALGTMAAAIGNSRVVRIIDGWQEPAVLWLVIAADSGAGKTPALDLICGPLYRLDDEAHKKYLEEVRHAEDAQQPTRSIRCQRCVFSDTTLEALAIGLADNPRGVLVANDELASWLGGFSRHAGGSRSGSEESRWLPLHNAGRLTQDRVTRDGVRVPRAAVSVMGCVQPGTLARMIEPGDMESGLVARMLFSRPAWLEKRWRRARPLDPGVEAAYDHLVRRLAALELSLNDRGEPVPFAVSLDDGATEVWAEHFDSVQRRAAPANGAVRSMLMKLEGGGARLALVLHLGRWAAGEQVNPDRIDGESMRRAATLAHWFCDQALGIYRGLMINVGETQDRAVLEFLAQRPDRRCLPRDLQRRWQGWFPAAEDVEQLLERLEQRGAVRRERRQGSGPPSQWVILVEAGPSGSDRLTDDSSEGLDVSGADSDCQLSERHGGPDARQGDTDREDDDFDGSGATLHEEHRRRLEALRGTVKGKDRVSTVVNGSGIARSGCDRFDQG